MKANMRRGFTIVELLIVVVVIAILAAVTIVAYNGISGRAKEAAFKSDLSTATRKVLAAKIQNGSDTFPNSLTAAGLTATRPSGADSDYEYTISGDAFHFCLASKLAGITWVTSDLIATPTTGQCEGAVAMAGTGVVLPAYVSKKISLGNGQACQVKSSTQLYCWGYGIYGKQGDGASTNNLTPTLVTTTGVMAGKSITQVAVGADHVCAIASGQVFCWGDGSAGRFGNGTTAASSLPLAMTMSGVLNGLTATDISVGAHKTCIVASDDWSYCAGENMYGQLGDGTQTGTSLPVAKLTTGALSGLKITAVDARGFRSSCVVANSRGYCSGYNGSGGLGVGNTSTQVNPTAVLATGSNPLNGKNLVAIGSGPWGGNRCALDDAGKVYCWGGSALGNGTTGASSSAVAVTGPLASKTTKQIAVGDTHACALTTDNMIYCWGANSYGQVGDGTTTTPITTPVPVDLSGAMNGKTITDIAASGLIGGTYTGDFTCAIASGDTFCWGRNEFGNLGDGSTTLSSVPVKVTFP